MSLLLPPADSPVRELFDVADLAAHGSELGLRMSLPTLRDAKAEARRQFADNRDGIKAINFIVLRADDSIDLIRVGPRGGWTKLWRFA